MVLRKLILPLFLLALGWRLWRPGSDVVAGATVAILGGEQKNADWVQQQLSSAQLAEGLGKLIEQEHPPDEGPLKDLAYRLQSENRLRVETLAGNTVHFSFTARSPEQALWLCKACCKWLEIRLRETSPMPKLPPEKLQKLSDEEEKLQECETRLQASWENTSRLPVSFAELRYQDSYRKLRKAREDGESWLRQAADSQPRLILLSQPDLERREGW